MTTRERILGVLRGEKVDRLPCIEWASWWDKTIERWQQEGLPTGLDGVQIKEYFGLDIDIQFWIKPCPAFEDTRPALRDAQDYRAVRGELFADQMDALQRRLEWAAERQQQGDAVWLSFDGFFWFPRRLLGIERHLYAFYDQPELLLEMNRDLTEFNLRVLERVCETLTPDFMTFGEDMSYNLGPMLSRESFEQCLLPFYRQMIPELDSRGIFPIVDTDGDLSSMVPWLIDAGVRGALPLERQAGVDVAALQSAYPGFALIGGYDKMRMFTPEGSGVEASMRAEFQRLLPAMRAGRYINSVDHQTPPSVSLEDYLLYIRLLKEASHLPQSMLL